MKLYHGTSSRHLEAIKRRGLQPRGKRKQGNWKHSVTSSPDHVYLTNCYAMHYAACSQSGDSITDNGRNERLLILEVDTSKVLPWNLYPDEDFLFQAMRENFPGPAKHVDMKSRTAWFRDNLEAWQGAWEESVKCMGTCSHEGGISSAAITRYALIPRTHDLRFMSDPTIGILNHGVMGHFYKALTAHVFGDSTAGIKPEMGLQYTQVDSVARMVQVARDGIEVVEVKHE